MLSDAIRITRIAEHSFLAAPIDRTSVVVDLGVNRGAFATGMIDAFGCTIVGVEPVPALFAALGERDRFAAQQLAITGDGKPVELYVNPTACATIDQRLSQSGADIVEVEGITLEGLLDRNGLDWVPLVKVDIEGAEIEMIENASLDTLRRVDQFTIEFHDFLDPGMADAVRRARHRLRSAGFADFSLSGDTTDVLFVNGARIPFGPVHRAAAALTQKYPRGLQRKWRRSAGRGGGAAAT